MKDLNISVGVSDTRLSVFGSSKEPSGLKQTKEISL